MSHRNVCLCVNNIYANFTTTQQIVSTITLLFNLCALVATRATWCLCPEMHLKSNYNIWGVLICTMIQAILKIIVKYKLVCE